ncbi:hypothetical protein BGZ58_004339 [Dissophora ornata]|nr:hypothetical protein BGZ58_004339 [Dissophora ornata]
MTRTIDLNGEWHLSSMDKSIMTIAMVPGQVHLDLIHAKILTEDPYYGTNYVKNSMRKIIETTWVYEKEFVLEEEPFTIAVLDCEGLDTIANITLNDVQVGSVRNQFRRYFFNVHDTLKAGSNRLRIEFADAVEHAKEQAEAYPPISLKLDEHSVLVKNWGLTTSLNAVKDAWELKIRFEGLCDRDQTLRAGLKFDDDMPTIEWSLDITAGEYVAQKSFLIRKSRFKQWWPRGYGEPNLCSLHVTVMNENMVEIASHLFQCGFRTCELIQDPLVQKQPGDAFKFRVNGVDIFAKGTNWIPGHAFDRLATIEKKRSLLESCVSANMNMIRIWGGGRYETDEFYQLCDELGIMVWQEFMFACALYPTNEEFLDNIKYEVSDQVKRLMVHPCIILWSGNNENQEFMVKGWDVATVLNPYVFTVDYHKLYIETIMSTLHTLDVTRPFISTSPSAGLISKNPYTERYILQESERGLYGDVHFYDYKHNGLHVENYPKARFVSGRRHAMMKLLIPGTLLINACD